jgi:hypothetical protein
MFLEWRRVVEEKDKDSVIFFTKGGNNRYFLSVEQAMLMKRGETGREEIARNFYFGEHSKTFLDGAKACSFKN